MDLLYSRIRDWGFVGLLLGIAFMVGMDLREFADKGALWQGGVSWPIMPAAVETNTEHPQTASPHPFVTTEEETLRQPIAFAMTGGLLRATGTIDESAAERLAELLEQNGQPVRIASLNSPGGALDDAIAMGRLLREHRISTVVEDGAICASSCPLVFAGGIDRSAGAKAGIGLHQFYAGGDASDNPTQIMADAQLTTARISRHLLKMGVDPALWLHALETPPRALYYLDPDQMSRYRLTTAHEKLARR